MSYCHGKTFLLVSPSKGHPELKCGMPIQQCLITPNNSNFLSSSSAFSGVSFFYFLQHHFLQITQEYFFSCLTYTFASWKCLRQRGGQWIQSEENFYGASMPIQIPLQSNIQPSSCISLVNYQCFVVLMQAVSKIQNFDNCVLHFCLWK